MQILDKDNHVVHNKSLQRPSIEEFYKGVFNQEDRNTVIKPWTGSRRPLEQPITELNNGRAYRKDGTPGELYRY
jgi:hypothetical protein